MILQLGLALGAVGSAILQTGIGTLFTSGPQPRGLTPREVGRIVRRDQQLALLGERAIIGEDPFTGGTLLFRESQTEIPGLVEQLALEAGVRREEVRLGLREVPTARQLSAGEFPVSMSGTPRVIAGPTRPLVRPIPPGVTVTSPGGMGAPSPPMIPPPGPIGGGMLGGVAGAVPSGCFPGTIAGRRACQPLRSAFV